LNSQSSSKVDKHFNLVAEFNAIANGKIPKQY